MPNDQIEINGQAEIIENRGQPELYHEPLYDTGRLVPARAIETSVAGSHNANQGIGKGTQAIKRANPYHHLMICCTTCLRFAKNIVQDDQGALEQETRL